MLYNINASICILLATFFLSCEQKKVVSLVSPLPKEIQSSTTDSFNINSKNLHYGHIEITDGMSIIQVSDEATRQDRNILVLDLHKKKNYGSFPWPDPQNSWYFGVAPYKDTLLYFNNYQYLRKLSLTTHVIDTIPLKTKISELVRMIVIGDKAYSLGNIYGINIVDINNTDKQLFIKPFKGSYYNEQNNISTPVQEDLNLVASAETAEKQYTVYAIGSSMDSIWSKTFELKNHFIKITSLNIGKEFLVKFDNHLVLINKTDGSTLWQKDFDLNILKQSYINANTVLLFMSELDVDTPPLGETHEKSKIISFNILQRKENWSIENQGRSDSKSAFILGNYLFNFIKKNRCQKINLRDGHSLTFEFPSADLDIISDFKTGRDYLLYQNHIYW